MLIKNNNIIGEKYSFYSETTCQKLSKFVSKLKENEGWLMQALYDFGEAEKKMLKFLK